MNQNLCNNCGGEYEYRNGRWICRACGAFKPEEISNEEVTLLYTAYQDLRLAKFTESEQEFDDIIEKYPQNPNGYWGRLMARYGIKYERDFDGRMIPTCYATSIESLLSASDYKKALQYADKDTRAYYREQAEYMERVRKEWIEKASHEKPYDIFICYKDSDLENGIDRTQDSIAAQDLYIHLTNKGYRVFYSHESLRDKVGEKYEPYIFNALSTAKVMLVYGSKPEYITSTWLKNEWTRYEKRIAAGEKDPNSLLVACEGFSPGELPTELSSRQCFNASAKSFYGDLDDKIDQILHPKKKKAAAVAEEPKKKSKAPLVVFLCLLLAAGIFFGINSLNKTASTVTNPSYNVTVSGVGGTTIPLGTDLKVSTASKTSKYEDMVAAIEVNPKNYKLYDMTLVKNGKTVDPSGKVEVSLPIPSGIDRAKAVVYYMSGNKAEKMTSHLEGNNIVFTTSHFSVYMIAESSANCNHNVVTDKAVAATCTKDGLTEGTHCSICNKVLKAQTVVKAAHKPGATTCEGGQKCTVCGKQLVEAKGHNYVTRVVSPTCTAMGYTLHSCTKCSYNYKDTYVAKTAHTPGPAATCTSSQGCTVCRTILQPALGHESASAATCTEAEVCIRCNRELNPALGHTFSEDHNCDEDTYCLTCEALVAPAGEHVPGADATCTLPQLCLACDEVMVPALGHTHEGVTVDPTCTTEGYTTYTCHCGDTYTEYTAALGHTFGEGATCDADQICTTCGQTVASTGSHIPGAEATCTSDQTCNVCGEVIVPALGHAPNTPACTDPCLCTVCGVEIRPATGHGFWIETELSETVEHYTVINDANNPFTLEGNTLASTNHGSSSTSTYTITALRAFTLELEYRVSSESGCDYLTIRHNSTQLVRTSGEYAWTSLSINMQEGDTVTFTYSKDGSVDNNSDCIFIKLLTPASSTTGLEFVEATEEYLATLTPHCTDDICCDLCGTSLVSPAGHTEVFDERVEPTKTENGYTAGSHCSVCGATLTGAEILYATGSEGLEYQDNGNGTYTIVGIGSCTDTEIYIPYYYNSLPVTAIGEGAFSEQTSLTMIVIPESVNTIGRRAFYGCTGLTEMTIPANVTDIGAQIFYRCTNLATLTYNSSYGNSDNAFIQQSDITKVIFGGTTVPSYILYQDAEITEVEILDTVTRIGYGAFYECTALSSVTIGSGVTYIEDNAFYKTTALTSVTLGESIQTIGNCAFQYSGITELVIPNSVRNVYSAAFNYCTSLASITFGSGLTYIGNSAFESCTALTEITIPGSVATIDYYAFRYCTSLTTVEFSEGTTAIYDYAFDGCTALASVTFPNSLTSIGSESFRYCSSLTSVTLPEALVSLGSEAFRGCTSLTEIVIPNNVTSMGSHAFYGCTALESAVISDGLSSIPSSTFAYCTALTSVTIPDTIATIGDSAFYGCTSLMSIEIPDSVSSIGSSAFYGCENLLEVINHSALEMTVGSDSHGYIAYYAKEVHSDETKFFETEDGFLFYPDEEGYILIDYKGSATEVVLPESVNESTYSIGAYAFYNRSDITSITIPEGVTAIGAHAFDGCTGLTSVTVPDSVAEIGAGAFQGCIGLTEMTIPFVGGSANATEESASVLFGYIFGTSSYEGTTGVSQRYKYWYQSGETYSSSTTNTWYYIPSGLTKVTVTGGTLWYGAFYDCDMLTEIVLSDGVTTIGERAFYDCDGLTSITISDGVTTIGERAFYSCSNLASVTFGSGLTTIGELAFECCAALTSVTIPDSVTEIGAGAFAGCIGLTEMTIPFVGGSANATEESASVLFGYIFGNSSYEGTTSVSQHYKYWYQSGEVYDYSTSNIWYCIPSGLTKVTVTGGTLWYGAFSGCSMLTEIVLPEGLTAIGDEAFYDCTSLTEIAIPEGVTSIGTYAFYNCDKLTTVVIPDGVTTIGTYAFYDCYNLKSVTLGSGLTTICDYAFAYNDSLISVVIPDSVTTIGASAFYNCDRLMSVTIGAGVTTIDSQAFYVCGSLIEVINLSTLELTKGSDAYGYIAYYAKDVHSGESKLYETEDGFLFYLGDEDCYLVAYNGTATELVLPDSIGDSTYKIHQYAFQNRSDITSITLSEGVTEIGERAFDNCSSLTSIVVPDSVTSIGYGAFSGCVSLAEITIPFVGKTANASESSNSHFFGYIFGNSNYYTGTTQVYQYYPNGNSTYFYIPSGLTKVTVTGAKIPATAFYGCSMLTEIVLSENIESIGAKAFYNCSGLTAVSVPESVTAITIGTDAFYGCNAFPEDHAHVPGDAPTCSAAQTCSICGAELAEKLNHSLFVPGEESDDPLYSVTNDSDYTFTPNNSGVLISNNYYVDSTTAIYTITALRDFRLTLSYRYSSESSCDYLTITHNSDELVRKAGHTSAWTSLTIYLKEGDTVTFSYIKDGSNSYNDDRAYIQILTEEAGSLIEATEEVLATIVPHCVDDICCAICGEVVLEHVGHTEAIDDAVAPGVNTDGLTAGSHCSVCDEILTAQEIVPATGTVGLGFTLSDDGTYYTVTGIGEATDTEIYIPKFYNDLPVKAIAASAFAENTAITKITIAEGIQTIGNRAFYGCTALTEVTIPSTVTSIGTLIFRNASALSTLNYNSSYSNTENAFIQQSSITKVVFGGASVPSYILYQATNVTEVVIEDTVRELGYGAFYGCTSLTTATIGSGVTSFYSDIFYGCTSLASVTLKEGISTISYGMFNGCTSLAEITIPSSVTHIGAYAFNGCTSLAEITIPDSVTEIGNGAFYGCTGLTTVTVGSGVTSMGTEVFSGCTSLASLTLTEGLTLIGGYMFSGCTSLTEITIPDSVTTLGHHAFYGCTGLTTATIGGGLTSIGNDVFRDCTALTSVTFGEGISYIGTSMFEGCTSLTEIVIPDSATAINSNAFNGCTSLASVTIGNGVTAIYSNAFYGCTALETVTFGSGVTSIGDSAFYGCTALAEITLPNTLTSMGSNVFQYCTALAEITIPNSVTSLGTYVFYGCTALESAVISDGLTYLPSNTFYGCTALTEIDIPDTITYIDSSAFRGCTALASVTIPNSVTSIGSHAFRECISLATITIPASVTSINSNAFRDCTKLLEVINLSALEMTVGSSDHGYVAYYAKEVHSGDSKLLETEDGFVFYLFDDYYYLVDYKGSASDIVLPESVNESPYAIYAYAFADRTGITSITFSEGVTGIGAGAFRGCTGLTSIVIPDSVTEIGAGAFAGCIGLTEMTIPFVGGSADATEESSSVLFGYIFGTSSYDGTTGVLQDYKYWYQSGDEYYYSTSNLWYYLPSGLTKVTVTGGTIWYGAFSNCSMLTEIVLSDGVTTIGERAFYYCSGITSIVIPDSVTTIGNYAFYYCSKLLSVVIPDSVTTIGQYAFYDCDRLMSVTIGAGVTTIDTNAFYSCETLYEVINLSALELSKGSDAYGYIAYYAKDVHSGESKLYETEDGFLFYLGSEDYYLVSYTGTATELVLPDSIGDSTYKIHQYAFQNRSDITSITLSEGVTAIGRYAFAGCTNLAELTIPASVTVIGSYAFWNCTNLASVTLSEGLETIENYAFQECVALNAIVIPESVKLVAYGAFSGCAGLTEMTIPFVGQTADASTSSSYHFFGYIFGQSSFSGTTCVYQYYTGGSYEYYYIPSGLTKVTVTGAKIPATAFYGCPMLTEIVLSENIESIGAKAFYNCSGLTAVVVPESVTAITIGTDAFYGCSAFPEDHAHVPGDAPTCSAVQTCPICGAELAEKLNHSIFVPEEESDDPLYSVTNDSDYTFTLNSNGVLVSNNYCVDSTTAIYTITALRDFRLSLNYRYSSESGCDYLTITHNSKELVRKAGQMSSWTSLAIYLKEGDTVTFSYIKDGSNSYNDDTAYIRITGEDALLEVTEEVLATLTPLCTEDICCGICGEVVLEQAGHTEVADDAVAPGVNTDGLTAGSHCSVCDEILTAQEIVPATGTVGLGFTISTDGTYYTVTGIGEATDTEIYIPKFYNDLPVKAIAASAFAENTAITKITIAEGIQTIGNRAFYGCTALTEVTIPSTVTSIGTQIFRNASALSTLNYNSSYSNSENTFIQQSSITKVVFGGTSVPSYILYQATNVTEVVIEDTVTELGSYAFAGCTGLTEITIPNSVKTINSYAFAVCTSLTSIVVPDSVTTINSGAFAGCSGLTELTIPYIGRYASATSSGSSTMFGYIFGTTNYTGTTSAYNSYNGSYYYIPTSLTTVTVTGGSFIGNYAFQNCTMLTSITLPETLTSIGQYAFNNCDGLTELTIPETVTSVGSYAFYDCDSLESMVIPDSVTSLNSYAFNSCDALAEVTLSASLTSISSYLFQNCVALETVEIPSTVTSIGSYAFYGCTALTEITIPNTVTSIGDYAFYGCTALTEIVIPDSVTSIGSYAFSGCTALIEFVIPNSVTSLGTYVFYGCTALESAVISDALTSLPSYTFSGCTSLTYVDIPDSIATIGNYAFRNCSSLMSVTIPTSVTSIGTEAFYGCTKLLEVINHSTLALTVGNSGNGYVAYYALDVHSGDETGFVETEEGFLFYIGEDVQYLVSYNGEATEVVLPDSVGESNYEIYRYAFSGRSDITSITISEGVTAIGDYAFYGCSALTEITIPDSVETIGSSAFAGCVGLASATLGEGLTSIGSSAFSGCSALTEITVPDSVTSIGSSAFAGCVGLTEMTIPFVGVSADATSASSSTLFGYIFGTSSYSGTTGVSQYYSGNSYTYYIPTGLTKVTVTGGELFYGAFSGCSMLTEIVLPEDLTSIGERAFLCCTGLTSIVVPDSVTSIGYSAFAGCIGLTEMTIPFVGGSADATSASASTLFGYIFGTSKYSGTLDVYQYYSSGSYQYYYIPSGLTKVTVTGGEIFYGAFYDCSMLTEIVLPEDLTAIGDCAFYRCNHLTEITIPEGVTTIGTYAFYDCVKLASVVLPESVTSIGTHAFYNCDKLTTIVIPEGVTSIGTHAFYNCDKLTTIVIPEGVTAIGDYTFYDCDGLISIVIPDGVTTIGNYAFRSCNKLTSVTIGAGVTSIGTEAFFYCDQLFEIINLSTLELSAGSSAYGYVACYAKDIHDGDSKLTVTDDGFAFYLDGETYYLMGYIGTETELVFPDSVNDSTYKIYQNAFYNRSDITSITLSEGVTEIGNRAFYGCTGLTSIVIPESVTVIGTYAFYGCSNLASVTLSEGLKTIDDRAFEYCTALTEITVPDSVTTIGYAAFGGCASLAEITIPFVGNTANASESDSSHFFGYIFGKDGYTGTTQVYQYYPNGNSTYFYIPSGLTKVTVTGAKIPATAFYGCTMLTEIVLSENIESIGAKAFYNCSGLTAVVVPESVTAITVGANAFYGCSAIPEDHAHVPGDAPICSVAQTCPICGAELAEKLNHSVWVPDESGEPFFNIVNDSNYPFTYENGILVSTNHNHNSSASYTLTALSSFTLNLEYKVSSEGNCDPLTIRHNSTQLVSTGGQTSWTNLTVNLRAGDTLTFTYSKDGSVNTADDCAYVKLPISVPGSLVEATEEFIATLTPLCTEDICCGTCGEVIVEHVGHTEAIDEAVAPTKTETGLTEGSHCSACGEILVAQETVWALGSEGLAFQTNSDGTSCTITGIGTCTDTEIAIPRYYNDLLVTAIAESAFSEQTQITSFIFLSDNVTTLGRRAFYGCTGLTEFTVPASVTNIGAQVFFHCDNLATLTYNSTYSNTENPFIQQSEITKVIFGGTSVPANVLYQAAGVTEIEILDTVTTIGSSAFAGCTGLTSVVVPDSVTTINGGAFAGCSALTELTIPFVGRYASATSSSSSTTFGYIFGTSSSYAGTTSASNNYNTYYIPTSLTTVTITGGSFIGAYAFQNCTMLTSITLPETLTSISDYAFYNCDGLTELTIPATVTSIASRAFYDCDSLTSMVIPDSVTSLGSYAFYSCDVLAEVTLPSSLTSISSYLFRSCVALETIEIPSTVTSIGDYAFNGCTALGEIVLPDSVTTINQYAFYGCTAMESVTFGSGITTIGNYVFQNCTSLEEAHVPNTVTSMGTQVFYGCTSLKSATISDSLAAIPSGTFYGCSSLTEIEIPDSIVTIGSEAFRNCRSLLSVEIPRSVKAIDSNAFNGCEKLVEVINKTTLTFTVGDSGYGYVAYYAKEVHSGTTKLIEDENGFVFYPTEDSGYLVAYKGSATELVLPDDCNGNPYEIYKYAFYNRSEITSVVIPEGVTAIGASAFGNCSSLAEITVADSVTSIGASAFSGCGSLAKMTIPFVGGSASATEASASTLFGYIFGTSSFTGATNYTQQYYASSSYTRYYIPTSLTEVTVAGGNILYGAFYNCSMLTSVTLGDGVTAIGERAFYNCTGLTEIEIPDSVTSIGQYAFSGCSGLTEITVPFVGTGASSNYPLGHMFGGNVSGMTYVIQHYYTGSSYGSASYYIPSGLTTVTVTGGSLTPYAFDGCTMLTSVTLGENVTSIGKYAFYNCTGLSEITIPDGVTSIGDYAFYNCTELSEITIPEAVTSIGNYAFYNCTGLTTINYNGTIDQWWEISFGGAWNYNTGNYSIVCTDGTLSKDSLLC